MKERLIQLLDLEQLTPSKFADIIGVQRSSVSHVISGRNNPSFDFIQKTLRAFPGLHAEWLILGEGSMYEQMGRTTSGNLFEDPALPQEGLFQERIPAGSTKTDHSEEFQAHEQEDPVAPEDAEIATDQSIKTDEPSKITGEEPPVVQVMVFYADTTFKTYKPSK